jgi:hypothetical protein
LFVLTGQLRKQLPTRRVQLRLCSGPASFLKGDRLLQDCLPIFYHLLQCFQENWCWCVYCVIKQVF